MSRNKPGSPPARYDDLRALFVNCTLKPSPQMSHTDVLMQVSMPQENFVLAVGIKDGPCKANAGDIIFLAYKMEENDHFWDCILRVEGGRITKILKINIDNETPPNKMIDYLLEPNCK
jgi:hypothetical protein